MEEFSLPEDIAALNDEELDALLDGAINAFDPMSRSSTVTTDDLIQLRELATGVENLRAEKVRAHKPGNASHSPIVYSATNVYTLVVIRMCPFTYVRWSKGKGRCQQMGAPPGARHHGDSGALPLER